MRIEDLKNWTVDQLKEEVVRLADEREAKQHEILHKNEKINELYAELDKMFAYNNKLIRQVSVHHFTTNLKKSQNITGSTSPIASRLISFRLRWTYLLTDMRI